MQGSIISDSYKLTNIDASTILSPVAPFQEQLRVYYTPGRILWRHPSRARRVENCYNRLLRSCNNIFV